MENKLWFKAKNFGWGWYPITWQGWAIIILYIIGIFPNLFADSSRMTGGQFLMDFGTDFIILTVYLLVITYIKGEKPGFRWRKDKSENNSDIPHTS